jgi:hypothetical protein
MDERAGNGVWHRLPRSMIACEAREIIVFVCTRVFGRGQEIAVFCRRDAVMHLGMSGAFISILLPWTSAAP